MLVGITNTSNVDCLHFAKHAADCGATALVWAPQYYFPAGQAELLEYLQHMVAQLPLPLFLYNMPGMVKTNINVDTLKKAADMPGIVGFKDSSGNMIQFHEYIKVMAERDDFSLLMGPEELIAEAVLFGGHGGVSGGANVYPNLYVKLYEAAVKKSCPEVLKLQKEVFKLRRIYFCGHSISSGIKGIKCALKMLNICNDCMTGQFNSFLPAEQARVREILQDCNLL